MQIVYTVHRASTHDCNVPARLDDGAIVMASVECLEVELVPPEAAHHGTVFLSFLGDGLAPARALFVEGAKILGSFTPIEDVAIDAPGAAAASALDIAA